MRKNRIISMCLAASLVFAAGCGSNEATVTNGKDAVNLVEPQVQVVSVVTEEATKRDIHVADIYTGVVFPEITEYSYESSQRFKSYGKALGDEVKKGDVLVFADDESVNERVEDYQERIDKLTESYQEYLTKANEKLAEAEGMVEYYAQCLENMQENKPTDTQSADYDKRYAAWVKENHKWEGQYNLEELNVVSYKEEMRQKKEIYNLDFAHYNAELKKLKAQQQATKLRAEADGVVVAARFMSAGSGMAQDSPVIAVASDSKKYVRCDELIYRLDVLYNAADIYAFINGKRYEVTYVDDEDAEYTTFLLHDEYNEVTTEDYVDIVLVKKTSREQVVAIPNTAIYGNIKERYVYVVKDGKTVETPVKTGASDNTYTEVLSGVEEGDLVQVPTVMAARGSQELVLERTDFHSAFTGYVKPFFTESVAVKNPLASDIEVYLVSYLVSSNQLVQEGDPIAKVRVVGDELDLIEMEREIQRDEERLADTVAARPEEMSEEAAQAFDESVEATREKIAEKVEELTELKEAYGTTEIYAPATGYVQNVQWLREELLLKSGQTIATIVKEDNCYLAMDDSKSFLSINDVLTYESGDPGGIAATVVNLDNRGLSVLLQNEQTLLKMPEQYMKAVLKSFQTARSGIVYYNSRGSKKVEVDNVLTRNVMLIPAEAVSLRNGVAYVNVVQEDGTVVLKSFIAGKNQYFKNYYWVIDGLTEGMKICWE